MILEKIRKEIVEYFEIGELYYAKKNINLFNDNDLTLLSKQHIKQNDIVLILEVDTNKNIDINLTIIKVLFDSKIYWAEINNILYKSSFGRIVY